MHIQLSDHFTFIRLSKFVMPSIIMMIFTSVYGVVDGLFVSNYVGKTPFAAVNLIMPFIMGMGALGFMIGTGGSALVSKTLGEGRKEKANEIFTMLVVVTAIAGIVLTIIGVAFIRPIAIAMGADSAMLEYCVVYGRILIGFQTAFMLQNVFQSFFVTAEKPHLGLKITLAAGFTNMILDAVFVAVFRWGVVGAAAATVISQIVGGIIPLIYFSKENSSLLKFTKFKFNSTDLYKTCGNGASELMTNLSMSIVNILYNFQLMKFAGEDGVASYGVIMYVNFIFVAIFIGYTIGCAPIVGYNYGSGNRHELQNVFKKSLIMVTVFSIVLTVVAEVTADPLSRLFVGYDLNLFNMTVHAFRIYSISFLITGFNIFASAFFTALSNGFVSATISFLRTLLFQIVAVLIFPAIWGLDGIWVSICFAELAALIITIIFFITQNKTYHYIK